MLTASKTNDKMASNQKGDSVKDILGAMVLMVALIAIMPVVIVVTITLVTTVGPFVLIAAIVWGLWAYFKGR